MLTAALAPSSPIAVNDFVLWRAEDGCLHQGEVTWADDLQLMVRTEFVARLWVQRSAVIAAGKDYAALAAFQCRQIGEC